MAGYIPVRGKETRMAQLHRIARAYLSGQIPCSQPQVVAANLNDVAERLAHRMSEKKAVQS